MQYIKNPSLNIFTFILCAILVFFIQFTLYQSVIQYRIFNITEDWPFLIYYNLLQPNPLVKVIDVWTQVGLHTTAQIYHIGVLSYFFGDNYQAYQIVNVFLKAIGTISFFPLILILFKDRKLAFLGTLLFGMSSATAGSFLWVVKGSEYLGIMLMNLFLITYYFVIVRNSKKLLILSSILFLMSYLMAPPRMFPLLILVSVVELYWLLHTRKFSNLKHSILRGILYILPVILISLPAPVSSCCPFTSRPQILLKDLINGNWHNLLDPFAGIGWTLLTNDFWRFFGKLEVETFTNFTNYMGFLLNGPLLIFGVITLILAPVLSKRVGRVFVLIFGLNLIAEILMFFLAGQRFSIPENLVTQDSPGHFIFTKYPVLAAIYVFVVAFISFLEWRKDKQNNLLKAIWVGPIFSVIFLWPTWVVMGTLINDWISVHWYFGIPALGTTLFLAAILVLFYEKLKGRKIVRIFAVLIILIITFIFYKTHGAAIDKQYLGINPQKLSLIDQQIIQGNLIDKLGNPAKSGDLLIYLDIGIDNLNLRRTPQYYKEALVIADFGDWVHFRRSKPINEGCIEVILEKEILKSTVTIKNEKVGFLQRGLCIEKNDSMPNRVNKDDIFYELEDFYAFRLQSGEFVNIREEILKDL